MINHQISPIRRAKLNRRATQAAIFVAGSLVLAKGAAWWVSNSLSLQASLLDSILDIFASCLNFFAVQHALRPADAEHRFGHGKVEALASLGQSIFIALSALWILKEGVQRFFAPEVVEIHFFGNAVMLFSMIATLTLVLFQNYVFRRTHSLAIKADSLHYKTDFLTNVAVLISMNAAYFFSLTFIDSLMGLGIALYIGVTSWTILKQSVDVLMDRELDDASLHAIKEISKDHPHVLGVHDLRTRSSGSHQFIQMHVDMDPKLSLLEAHNIALELTQSLKKTFPQAEILIHQDPYGHDEEDYHP